jgi:hypothetical protein
MKNLSKILWISLSVLIIIPVFTSCKKGDGDPFFSFYSRKERLTGDWKVSSIAKTITYKTTTITTSYDGNKKTVETFVPDTVVYTATDTLYNYNKTQTYTGTLYYRFDKDGTYQIDEALTDDTTLVKFTSQESGFWYFTGGGRDSDTKSKELLGLQPTNYVYNPLSPDTYTYTYDGENYMNVFHIYKLASKEINLRYNTEETLNLFTVKTDMEMVLKPK